MSKTMTKYQLDHFKDKVKRQFEPLISDQELLVRQYKTEATDKAVSKLSKKIGADANDDVEVLEEREDGLGLRSTMMGDRMESDGVEYKVAIVGFEEVA